MAKDMCSKLRYGRVEIIRGAGHAVHIERPREFNKAVLAFLDEANSRSPNPRT
jgi:pimeloyl-ACP methyl ester carboxylesterase